MKIGDFFECAHKKAHLAHFAPVADLKTATVT